MGKWRHFIALILAGAMLLLPTVALASPSSSLNVSTAALAKFTAAPIPLIVGHASVGTSLSVNVGNWIPAPDSTEIKWMVGSTVVGADNTYVVSSTDRGKNITVSVTASANGYQTTTKVSAKASATGVITASGNPEIASIVHQGDVLTASVPTFDPTPATVKYQWFRAGVAISGATRLTYTSVAADLNKTLTFKVTASLPSYDTLTLTSLGSEPVALNGFGLANAPTLSDTTPTFGNVITGNVAAWSPVATSLSYQWFRDATAIAGATKISYTVAAGDIGHALKLRVVGAKTNYSTTTLFSAPTEAVVAATLQRSADPTVTGVATQGQILTANTGTWTPSTTKFSYQWLRDDVAIVGATAKTYKAVAADVAHLLSVRVSASLVGYSTVILTSSPTVAVLGVFTKTTKPVIAGSLQIGNDLTFNPGTWTPTPDTFTYQWLKNGVAIEGETDSFFTVSESEFGAKISVSITGQKSGFASVTQVSAQLTTWPTTKFTVSGSDLFDACTSLGDVVDYNGDPRDSCDLSGSSFYFNSFADGSTHAGTSFQISTLHWGVYKWRAILNTVKKPDSTTEFGWYAIDSTNDDPSTNYDATTFFSGSYPAAGKSISTPWSAYSTDGDVFFEMWTSDYADLYIKSVTIEYYPDTSATDPNAE